MLILKIIHKFSVGRGRIIFEKLIIHELTSGIRYRNLVICITLTIYCKNI